MSHASFGKATMSVELVPKERHGQFEAVVTSDICGGLIFPSILRAYGAPRSG